MHWRIAHRREQVNRDRIVSLVRQNLDYRASVIPVIAMLFAAWIIMFGFFATWGGAMSTKFTGSVATDLGWGIAVAVAVGCVVGLVWMGSELINLGF